jgi:DNA polymerase-2
MLTFNIDPYAYEVAARGKAQDSIVTPNGAAFDRNPGVLPALIDGYFSARRRALAAGDENAAHVYKILMNSFYGVLGTPTCRYARTELAGAITSTARKWLRFSRDRFVERGLRVLYGDTDSLFVDFTPILGSIGEGDRPTTDEFARAGAEMAAAVNAALAEAILKEYRLESRLELRFEKLYRRFLIPPLRSISTASASPVAFAGDSPVDAASRGRAKGYAGLLMKSDGGDEVEVKGMEAVRSDSTPFARRLQVELLDRVFHDAGEAELLEYLLAEARRLESGEVDDELVYRRRLVRSPESYTSSTPPQVKAARALGWTARRGIVEYVWTTSGAEPVSARSSPLDRRHYLEAQLLPFAESLFQAALWDAGRLRSMILGSAEGQMELGL